MLAAKQGPTKIFISIKMLLFEHQSPEDYITLLLFNYSKEKGKSFSLFFMLKHHFVKFTHAFIHVPFMMT